MATRKRTSSRSRIDRAVKAGRTALRQAERRIPPDVRKQLERTVKDGQVRFDRTFKELRTRVTKAAGQADLDRARKNLESLRKQVEDMVRAFAQRSRVPAGTTARRTTRTAPSGRRTATRKTASTPRTTTRKAAAARKSTATAARKTTTRRTAPRRKATTAAEPAVRYVPPSIQEAPGPMPERVEMPEEGS
jgi:hypothetical protein